jgi:type VI secretion system secreted protein VgrG
VAVRLLVSVQGKLELLNRDIERLELVQELGRHDAATIAFFRDTSAAVGIDELAGKDCRVQIYDDDHGNDAPHVDFDGVIAAAEQIHQLHGGAEWKLDVVARSRFLSHDRNLRVFPELDIAKLAQLISPATTTTGAPTTERADWVQWGESDWDFLVRAADEAGCFVRTLGGKIEIRRGFETGGPTLTWGRELIALAVRAAPKNVGVKGWAYEVAKKEDYVFRDRRQEATFSGLPVLSGAVTKLARGFLSPGDPLLLDHQSRASTLAEFRERVMAESERALGGTILVDGACTSVALRAGSTVTVDDGGNFKLPQAVGEIGVIKVTHRWDGQQYRAEFVATPWEHFTNLEPPPRQTIAGLVSGECVDPKDPENRGRVQVRLHFQQADDTLLWMRVVAPFAGHDRGIQFMPEIGDEVAVAFEEGDPGRPYVLGALWNGKDQPPDLKYKQIVTKSGNTIRISDEDAQEAIQIFTPDGKCLLQLENASGGPTITIHSEGDISLEAKEELRIKCKTLVQDVGQDYIRKAGGAEKADATGEMVFSGGQVSVSSGSNMALSATINLDASAGAIHNVVGAMVNLNPPVFVKLPVMKASPMLKASAWKEQENPKETVRLKNTYDPIPSRGISATPGSVAKIAAGKTPAGTAAFEPTTQDGKKSDWIEIRLVDRDGKPVPGVPFKLELPDGTPKEGVLDANGRARFDGIEPGDCRITFPTLDKDSWEPSKEPVKAPAKV